MCSLCGILGGGSHWTDGTSHPEVFERRTSPQTRRAERQHRARLINPVLAHYGLKLSDWGGTSFVLKHNTGRSALVDNLSQLWPAAEELTKRACDPLDEALLASLDRENT